MVTSLFNLNVAVKRRATRCSSLKNTKPWGLFLALATIILVAEATKEVATNSFYVKIKDDPSQPDLAHKIARRNGFHNLGKVSLNNARTQYKKS